jgi:hypothetical protein
MIAAGIGISVPVLVHKWDSTKEIFSSLGYEANMWHGLPKGIEQAGGRDAVVRRGCIYSGAFQTQVIAYMLHINGRDVHWGGDGRPPTERMDPPGTVFRTSTAEQLPPVPPDPGPGWQVASRSDPWTILVNRSGISRCPAAG